MGIGFLPILNEHLLLSHNTSTEPIRVMLISIRHHLASHLSSTLWRGMWYKVNKIQTWALCSEGFFVPLNFPCWFSDSQNCHCNHPSFVSWSLSTKWPGQITSQQVLFYPYLHLPIQTFPLFLGVENRRGGTYQLALGFEVCLCFVSLVPAWRHICLGKLGTVKSLLARRLVFTQSNMFVRVERITSQWNCNNDKAESNLGKILHIQPGLTFFQLCEDVFPLRIQGCKVTSVLSRWPTSSSVKDSTFYIYYSTFYIYLDEAWPSRVGKYPIWWLQQNRGCLGNDL